MTKVVMPNGMILKIEWEYNRNVSGVVRGKWKAHRYNGYTVCILDLYRNKQDYEHGLIMAHQVGTAHCSTKETHFVNRTGRKYSLTYALRDLEFEGIKFNKDSREYIWREIMEFVRIV